MAEVPLAPPEVAALLRAAMTTLTAELGALPERLAAWHPAPGEWCVKEIVGHLIEAERRGFAGRIRILLAESDPALQTWDQNEVGHARLDEALAAQRAGVTAAAGGAVGRRLVARQRQRVIDAGRHPRLDDLGLGQADQRRADPQRVPPFDAGSRRQRGQALERLDELR